MLDDILNSSVFTLIAGVAVAVVVIALQPDPRIESAADHSPARTSALAATGPRQPLAASANASPPVVQLPTVIVTGHRIQPSEVVSVGDTN